MRSYIRKTLFLVVAVLAILLVCTACAQSDKLSKLEKDGYTCHVTFDFNGGFVSGMDKQVYYVKPNSLLFPLGADGTDTTEPLLSGCYLKEYYVKETAPDGTETERPWNFETDRVTGNITLYCRWVVNFSVRVLYGEGNTESVTMQVPSATLTLNSLPKANGYTFIGYYYDAAFEKPVTLPYTHHGDEKNPVETLYAKTLVGNYYLVSQPKDLQTVKAGGKYYLMNDIDMSGVATTFPDAFVGEILGNGHTVKNLTVTKTQSRTGVYYGLFNELGGNAVIRDITFENLRVVVSLTNQQNSKITYLGALAGRCHEDTETTHVTLENVTLHGSLVYTGAGRELSSLVAAADSVFGESPDEKRTGVTSDVTVEEIDALPTEA